ncbi:MAG: Snf7 family protein [Candidatus Helarchaeota archaeon]|nr:Snf7 family protein [Candidatus Helarchaeota archaeon]
MKKILPGRKKKDKESTIARLRQMINKLELRERAFKKRAQMDYYKAKQYYRSGNKRAAKQALKKWSRLNKYSERYVNYSSRLENMIIVIDQAMDIKGVDEAVKMGLVEMKSIQKDISIEKAEQVAAESDAAMAEIDQVGEIYAEMSSTDDLDFDTEADQELSRFEAEMILGEGPLPDAPQGGMGEPLTRKEKAKKEIEELRKLTEGD